MGVGKMVRKVAQSVKVIQKISVKDNQFIVVNVHRFAEDETIHYMNVGDKVILTPNGMLYNHSNHYLLMQVLSHFNC